jgi:hypothetical protein
MAEQGAGAAAPDLYGRAGGRVGCWGSAMAGSWCAAFCAVHLVFGCLAGGSRRWHRRPARWAVSGAGAVDLVPTAPDLARPVGLARQVAGDPDPGRSSTSHRLLRAAVCGDLGLLPRSMVVGCRGERQAT